MPNETKKDKQPFCTACEKGLVYVAQIIAYEDDEALKKITLCDIHRALLINTVNNVFAKEGDKNE